MNILKIVLLFFQITIHVCENVRCGRFICQQISGNFQKTDLPHGYVYVTTLPMGALNISIAELSDSKNLLVLKTKSDYFVFNGERGISPSGTYIIDDTVFEYVRNDDLSHEAEANTITEWIISTGNLTSPIDVLVLIRDINPGVRYEYLLPIKKNNYVFEETTVGNRTQPNELVSYSDYFDDSKSMELISTPTPTKITLRVPEKRKRRYIWKIIGFGSCSKSCGGGIQPPIFRCIRDSPTRFYSAHRCSHLKKPLLNEKIFRCNTQSCPPYWHIEDWTDCLCHNGQGIKERIVKCIQELSSGIALQVLDTACSEEKPEESTTCDCPKLHKKYDKEYFDRTRIHSHARGSTSTISISQQTPKPSKFFDNQRFGVWLISEWNYKCLIKCGAGIEYRSIFCDRTPPNSDRCDLKTMPDYSRLCESNTVCDANEWFTGPWSDCTGNCFNLTSKRTVFCMRNGIIVDELECNKTLKPDSLKNCGIDEVEYCNPQWYYSEWSSCSRTCGSGTQRRTVRCLEINSKEGVLEESNKCYYTDRQPVFSTCNTKKCPEITLNPHGGFGENDLDESCIDQLPNCYLVVKARLCSLERYKQNCCRTCSAQ